MSERTPRGVVTRSEVGCSGASGSFDGSGEWVRETAGNSSLGVGVGWSSIGDGDVRVHLISQESGRIAEVDRLGNVYGSITLQADPGSPLSIPDQTHEGVTLSNVVSSIVENTSTLGGIKVADITVLDDGLGTNSLALAGQATQQCRLVAQTKRLPGPRVIKPRQRTHHSRRGRWWIASYEPAWRTGAGARCTTGRRTCRWAAGRENARPIDGG